MLATADFERALAREQRRHIRTSEEAGGDQLGNDAGGIVVCEIQAGTRPEEKAKVEVTMYGDLQTRPIDQWPGQLRRARDRKRAPFRAGYGRTLGDLARELNHLRAKSSVLLMALQPEDIRLDGRPRAGTKPAHPGIILVIETPTRPMRFPCDTYDDWGDNLRAIVLALAALRAVDRYGVTERGEQYTGWAQLPSPNGDHWDRTAAQRFIESTLGYQPGTSNWNNAAFVDAAIRAAERKTHPDHGGDAGEFNKVQQARRLLISNG